MTLNMLRIPSSVLLGPRPHRHAAPVAEPPVDALASRLWSGARRSTRPGEGLPVVVDYGLLRRDGTALPGDLTRDSDLAA